MPAWLQRLPGGGLSPTATDCREQGHMAQATLLTIEALAQPFLKWAGGKRQLLSQLEARLPQPLVHNRLTKYCEPFVGSGAVLFYLVQRFDFQRVIACDINPELILTYSTIKRDVTSLVAELGTLEESYLSLSNADRESCYYELRDSFNRNRDATDYDHFAGDWVTRAAQLIFLNRTCFNGLYRVNSRGDFNVPFGAYSRPRICDADNLMAVARVLQGVELVRGDFTACDDLIDEGTFVYFDPPYRPLTATSSFTSYASRGFDDREQLRLAEYFRALDRRNAWLMLSNSDPQFGTPDDDFFLRAYAGYRIDRVTASRAINSDASKRGEITELLITNY